jgi:hypothetical protein
VPKKIPKNRAKEDSKKVALGNKGTFYVRAKANGTWYLYFQHYAKGKKQPPIRIQPERYREFDLNTKMTADQAKKIAKRLNAEKSDRRKAAVKAGERALKYKHVESIYFDADLCNQFVLKLQLENTGSWQHFRKLLLTLRSCKK